LQLSNMLPNAAPFCLLNPREGCGGHRTTREQRMNGNVPVTSSESVPVASPTQSHRDTVEYVGFRVDGQVVVLLSQSIGGTPSSAVWTCIPRHRRLENFPVQLTKY